MKPFILALCLAALACGSGVDNLDTGFAFVGGTETERVALEATIAEWRNAAPIINAGVREPHQARIEFADDLDGLDGQVIFEQSLIRIRSSLPPERMRRVALHELGHWFAWSADHSASEADVMNVCACADEPTLADVARIR